MDSVYVETFGDDYKVRVPKRLSCYDMKEIVGKGGTSVVIKAFDTKNKRIVAVKLVDRSLLGNMSSLAQFEREIRLFSRVNHPSIAKLYDIIYLPDIIAIVMEYCENGTILSNVLDHVGFNNEDVLRISKEILEGIQYLHQNGIAHRDIKPDNIGLDKNWHPKILDFGLSRDFSMSPTTTKCGSTFYIAPEVLTHSSYDPKLIDIWSYGVTIHVLATGVLPWCVEEGIFLRKILRGEVELSLKCTGRISEIINMSLVFDPEKRKNATEILESGVFIVPNLLSSDQLSRPRRGSELVMKKSALQIAGCELSRKRFVVRKDKTLSRGIGGLSQVYPDSNVLLRA